MCGIFYTSDNTIGQPADLAHRGPDCSAVVQTAENEILVFHRLAINGLSSLSNQPMTFDGKTYLLCNGEIYNYRALCQRFNIELKTGSDCEIVLHLFLKLGFKNMVKQLDGEFAIIIVTEDTVYAARDPYGVRSMYYAMENHKFAFASEGKALLNMKNVKQVTPGCYYTIEKTTGRHLTMDEYHSYAGIINAGLEHTSVITELNRLLTEAVQKRLMCDRISAGTKAYSSGSKSAIGAYLSGGFDSSIVAAILQRNYAGQLETFSIGFENAPDVLFARKVADFIGSRHHEYIITPEEALAAIPEVIRAIESYDTTTVRASTMMYLLSKYVREHTDIKVMFSGEGADEASGSYRYFHNAPSHEAFHEEALRLLKDLCYFDNLRADKSSAAWGLELRVPFLDLDFLNYYMTVSPGLKTQQGLEKFALREAFKGYLPDEVLYRPKEAMSDGVSLHERSWSSIIQDHAMILMDCLVKLDAEKIWYRKIFCQFYPAAEGQIPYYWVPKWCGGIQDPSARVLPFYIT